jgi:hypothetical protein
MRPRLSRVLLAAVALNAALDGTSTPVSAEGHLGRGHLDVDVVSLRDDGAIDHVVASESTREESAEPTRSGVRPRSRQVFYATFPTVDTQPDGSRCVRMRRQAYADPVAAAAATDAQNALWRLAAASFPLCQRAPVPESTPAAQAAEFWRVVGEDLLPKPAPRIAPGYMLAGKLAYLEAGTVSTAAFEHPTPAGVLRIEARAEGWVDWGDGSPLDGPHGDAGGPWPNGSITHHWTDVGRYDVRVIQRWTGRWVLGTEGGDLAGLETEGVIDDFAVEELQAVINR